MDKTTLDWINSVLQNDENASDKELVSLFIAGGLSVDQAKKAVNQRQKALLDRFYQVTL